MGVCVYVCTDGHTCCVHVGQCFVAQHHGHAGCLGGPKTGVCACVCVCALMVIHVVSMLDSALWLHTTGMLAALVDQKLVGVWECVCVCALMVIHVASMLDSALWLHTTGMLAALVDQKLVCVHVCVCACTCGHTCCVHVGQCLVASYHRRVCIPNTGTCACACESVRACACESVWVCMCL